MSEEKFQFFILTAEHSGRRLDKVIREFCPALSQIEIEKLLRSKMIRINKVKSSSDYRIMDNDELRLPKFVLEVSATPKPRKTKDTLEFDEDMVIYQDDDFMLLNKPHGLAVQGGSGTKKHLDMMLETLPKRNGFRPSSVHRLDRDTSGCLLVAKKRSIAGALGDAIKNHNIEKYYLAILSSKLLQNSGIIDADLIKTSDKMRNELVRIAEDDERGQKAQTLFLTLDVNEEEKISLVLLAPLTGRTHQLRVHMKHLEAEIMGDPKYGAFTLKWLKEAKLPEKLCLHAYRLRFAHPKTEKKMDLTAPIPLHFKEILDYYGLSIAGAKQNGNYEVMNFLKQQAQEEL